MVKKDIPIRLGLIWERSREGILKRFTGWCNCLPDWFGWRWCFGESSAVKIYGYWFTKCRGFDPETARPIVLTERAARQVQKIVEQEGSNQGYTCVLRLRGWLLGLSYKLVWISFDEDRVYELRGWIIVKEEHLMYLEGISIDYPDGLDARGFVFDNPNATDNCGCGESFAV